MVSRDTLTSSPLYEARVREIPPLPTELAKLINVTLAQDGQVEPEVVSYFPNLLKSLPLESIRKTPLKVGVVLSGGQAAGGHNVIVGLYKSLKSLNAKSELIGFLGGPKGIIENRFKPLTDEEVLPYLNTGGFDLIGSGRDKIETKEQFESALRSAQFHKLDGLVVIGGDDSNTNAALLAEYFLSQKAVISVVGVPKTIDGDLKNRYIEQSFGFDTAVRVYSELIGNILKDNLSAKKYWFFIRLMGRTASHITLEAALQTHPNLTLISEEHRTLEQIVDEMVKLIEERAKLNKNFGTILIPEGLFEFIPNIPEELLKDLKLSRDPHGNLEVSKIEIEKLFIELVQKKLDPAIAFSPLALFFGYEGRSSFPSLFDANYTYSLGHVATLLVAKGATGTMATVSNLKQSVDKWTFQGIPLIWMIKMEERNGKIKPVIKKSLVDLTGDLYRKFRLESYKDRLDENYRSPGPIQFWGPEEVTKSPVYS